jgi:hypothetical protein
MQTIHYTPQFYSTFQHSLAVILSKAGVHILLVKEQEIQQDETTHLLKRRKSNDLEKCGSGWYVESSVATHAALGKE